MIRIINILTNHHLHHLHHQHHHQQPKQQIHCQTNIVGSTKTDIVPIIF